MTKSNLLMFYFWYLVEEFKIYNLICVNNLCVKSFPQVVKNVDGGGNMLLLIYKVEEVFVCFVISVVDRWKEIVCIALTVEM